MIYTLEHGLQSTPQDKLITSLKYGVSGAVVGLFALLIGNIWYAHYYVAPSTGTSGQTEQTIQTHPVALTTSTGSGSMAADNDTTNVQPTIGPKTMQYAQAGYSKTPAPTAPTALTPPTPVNLPDPTSVGAIPTPGDTTVPSDPVSSVPGTTGSGSTTTGIGTPDSTSGNSGDQGGVTVTLPTIDTGVTTDPSGTIVTTPVGSLGL